MDIAQVRWLRSAAGARLVSELGPYDEARAAATSARLRAGGLAPELVAAALTQQRLRTRAVDKFGAAAAGMLFTPDGLEQATRLEIADGHAERFAAAGITVVHDLGCGIGSDAMAFAADGLRVEALDADPVTAEIARANLERWPDCEVRVGRVEDWTPPTGTNLERLGAWLDPARRATGVADARGRSRRVFSLDEISPSWANVLAIAERVPATGAKLAPSFRPEQLPPGAQAQWVSRSGELLECAIWWGPLARNPGRSARVLRPGRPPVEITTDAVPADVPSVAGLADVRGLLYESDRALVQAGLVGAVTAAVDGRELEPGLGYVTADRAADLGFARRYAVLDAMPLNVKALRAWLRARGITSLTVKKRGVRLDEATLLRELKVRPGAGATVLLTRVAGRQCAVVLAEESGQPAALSSSRQASQGATGDRS